MTTDMQDIDALVPIGAAYEPVAASGGTITYAFVLVPGFTLLAFSSAVEPLRIANQLSQQPLYRWLVLSASGEPVASSSGISLNVDGALQPLDRDVRLLVCAGNPPAEAAARSVVAAVQRHHRFGGIVGGICTGAVALAAGGLLADRRFTLHWENQPGFSEAYPDLAPTPNRFELDNRIITCAGGAASSDMMIGIIAGDHGEAFAATVSEMCLRSLLSGVGPNQRSSESALMSVRHPTLVKAIEVMRRTFENPVSIASIAHETGHSRRQLERLFVNGLGKSPAVFYRELRLNRGRELLVTTDLAVTEIAIACGYSEVAHFARGFRARYGVVPTQLKRALRGRRDEPLPP